MPSVADATVGADVVLQTVAVMAEIEKRLSLEGLNKHHIVKVESQLADIADLPTYNAAYNEYMAGVAHCPAQICCQAAALSPGVLVELSVTACSAPKEDIESAISAPTTLTAEGCGPLPFSPVVQCGDIVWLSGLLDTSVGEDVTLQTRAVMRQIEVNLAVLGMTKHHIVKLEAFLADINDLKAYNEAFDAYMDGVAHLPAQTACQPGAVCCGARVELCATASALPKEKLKSAVPAPTPVFSPFVSMPLPFSPVVWCGRTAWLSGMLDASAPSVTAQARGIFKRITGYLEEVGLTKHDVVKLDVLVAELSEFGAVDGVIREFMQGVEAMPPMSVLQPTNLCAFARVEITVICAAGREAGAAVLS